MALDCAGRQKEAVRRLMDKKEVVKQEKEVGKQEEGARSVISGRLKAKGCQVGAMHLSLGVYLSMDYWDYWN